MILIKGSTVAIETGFLFLFKLKVKGANKNDKH